MEPCDIHLATSNTAIYNAMFLTEDPVKRLKLEEIAEKINDLFHYISDEQEIKKEVNSNEN